MELIGKTRAFYEKDATPTLTINPLKGKMSLSKSAIKELKLFGSSFAIAYDETETNEVKAYIFEDTESGIQLPSTGNVTNKYHAKRLWDTLTDVEDIDNNTSIELQVSTIPHNEEGYPGMDFYEITYDQKVIEAESAVEMDSEDLAAQTVETFQMTEAGALEDSSVKAATESTPQF